MTAGVVPRAAAFIRGARWHLERDIRCGLRWREDPWYLSSRHGAADLTPTTVYYHFDDDTVWLLGVTSAADR